MTNEKKTEEILIEEEKARIESLITEKQPDAEDENSPENIAKEKDKKIKNLISAVILLAGLFVGSLFVDVIQLVKGGGFSQRALDKTDVFASNGKTWVAFSDPIVTVEVINDESCGEACSPDEVLLGLKQAIPTMLTKKVDATSEQGKKLVAQFSVKTIPTFIFSKEFEKSPIFANAQPFLDKQGDKYAIKSAEAGFPIGKYIATPTINDNDIKIGSNEAKIKVVAFSDFSNPTDAQTYKNVIVPMLKDYADNVQVIFKNYFAATSTQALSAALASECANEQGKFIPFAEKLYGSQATWSKVKDPSNIFNGYASSLGLNYADFSKCLKDKKYQDKVNQSLKEGQDFGISETVALFIGNDFQGGAIKYDDVKKVIDEQLAK